MSRNFIVKKCKNCGEVVKVMGENDFEIECCGEKMATLVPNSVDAAIEKHVPTYEVEGDKIIVKVNHVMEDEHYIEWIALVSDGKECTKYFKPGQIAETHFKYIPGSTLYAYCNKHALWKKDVE